MNLERGVAKMNLERGVAKMPEIAGCGNARDCRMRKCQRRQYNGECGNARIQWRSRNARKDNTMEKPKCQKRQYNAEVTPSMLPSLVLSNPNSILENARKTLKET